MLNRTSFLAMLLVFVTALMQESRCHNYQLRSSYPVNTSFQERQMMRRSHLKEEDVSSTFPKMESDFFGTNSDDSSEHSSRLQEENDSSVSFDETSVLDLPLGHVSQPMKRRKGPTLSVVNPLEILRQRLMLDLARRKIHENQQQIVANAQFLENIGKRSSPSASLRQRTEMRDNNFQP